MTARRPRKRPTTETGRLRIGDQWSAISIIASSQSNPLKAVAEFVENSIDAGARTISISRGKERGQTFLRITDDGAGIPRDAEGRPDFEYVATHICDSIKRRMKEQGAKGIQGEYGIGLLSFWSVGETLTLASAGADGRSWQMRMAKGAPGYTVLPRRTLVAARGTELDIRPLLPGLRLLSGEKIQWYLASELRDRIRTSGAKIRVVDRLARKEFLVEPRAFNGRLLHELPPASCPRGDVYVEVYLAEPSPDNGVGLYRNGTRVLERLTELEPFAKPPWNQGRLQGIVDAPFLTLTPGTRSGVIQDEAFADFAAAVASPEESLARIVEDQVKAEEEEASRDILKTIKRALREALLSLPQEEYDWFDLPRRGGRRTAPVGGAAPPAREEPGETDGPAPPDGEAAEAGEAEQKEFFDHAGPLHGVRIIPASCVVPVGGTRKLRAAAFDRARRTVEAGVSFAWRVAEGAGAAEPADAEIATFTAPKEPTLVRIEVAASRGEVRVFAEALVTVTDSIVDKGKGPSPSREGFPDYTCERAPGELWRSRCDQERNLIVVNSGHRDFVFASRSKALKLRYILRIYAKELVLKNFPGIPAPELLERLIELLTRTEERL